MEYHEVAKKIDDPDNPAGYLIECSCGEVFTDFDLWHEHRQMEKEKRVEHG